MRDNFAGSLFARTICAGLALALSTALATAADGNVVSPTWRATQVMSQRQGPLPINASFASGGGTLVVIFSGSGWSATGGNIGMNLQIDGVNVSSTRSYANEPGSHKAFTTNILVQANIAAGNHSIDLVALPGTSTDANDWFNVTVLELPI
jgi:hypothetical protein